jgi:hypothetical protein
MDMFFFNGLSACLLKASLRLSMMLLPRRTFTGSQSLSSNPEASPQLISDDFPVPDTP